MNENMAAWTTLWPYAFVILVNFISECTTLDCHHVKSHYKDKGFDIKDVPSSPLSGEHLKICPQGYNGRTCCTGDMEMKLSWKSAEDFDKHFSESTSYLRNTFISRTATFDEFFKELLENGKRDFHVMFVKTYGLLYERNAHIFNDLFNDLNNFYKGKNINLLDALESFFETLLQKMFQLLNAQYDLNQSYLGCVANIMEKLKPFGDVPQKFSIQVKRSFVAARTFVQGLAIGRDVVLQMGKISPSAQCRTAMMKMTYCSYCRSLPGVKPCNNYCLNTMKGCLAHQAELNQEWNSYIDALMKVANRLEYSFNIESVVDPMDVKISEAIMNLQENSEKIKTQVFKDCGQPRLSGRNKRNTDTKREGDADANKKDGYVEYAYGNWKYDSKEVVRPTTAAGTSLDRLVRDIKEKVKVAKDFWVNLPYALCNEAKFAAPPSNTSMDTNCWNGVEKAQYIPDVVKNGIVHQINNPEVEVDIKKGNVIVDQQLEKLRVIIHRLNNAYHGLDVDWIDMGDMEGDFVGSGSGSGSGINYDGSGGGYKIHGNGGDDTTGFSFTTKSTEDPVKETPRNPIPAGSVTSCKITISVLLISVVTAILAKL